MSISIVGSDVAAKAIQGLLTVRKVVVIVASRDDGAFVLDRFFERSRARRSDLEMRGGRPEPVESIDDRYVVQVAGTEISSHGAVTGHARAMLETNMAQADRLIVHVDADLAMNWTNGVADIDGIATVVIV
jgi:hypothetical protein